MGRDRSAMAAESSDRIGTILEEMFNLMDSDSNGKIDKEECLQISRGMGESEEEAESSWTAMLSMMDFDDNKEIEKEEYVEFFKEFHKGEEEEVISSLEEMRDAIQAAVKQ